MMNKSRATKTENIRAFEASSVIRFTDSEVVKMRGHLELPIFTVLE